MMSFIDKVNNKKTGVIFKRTLKATNNIERKKISYQLTKVP